MIRLRDIMGNIEYTRSQQNAVEAFRQFLDDDSTIFILKGAAGTGKTTILKAFVDIARGVDDGEQAAQRVCHVMAPTGRAAMILSEKTGLQASTVHRAIYMLSNSSKRRMNNVSEDDIIQLKFVLRKNEDSEEAIYFVDEASMIQDCFSENDLFTFGSGHLLKDLFSYADGRKIVFVGDYAQLPPVGQSLSPAMDQDYLATHYNVDCRVALLDEVVRQDVESGILLNATALRRSIDRKSFMSFTVDYADDVVNADNDLLEPYFRLMPDKPNPQSIVITHTNRQALQYNQAIRRHYFGTKVARLLPGELLMIARNNYRADCELFNGSFVRVVECDSDAAVERYPVRLRGSGKLVDLTFRKVKIEYRSYGQRKEAKVMLLDNFIDDENAIVSKEVVQAQTVLFHEKLPEKLRKHLKEIRSALNHPDEMKGNMMLEDMVKCYVDRVQKDEYFNAVVCKYGYAITCHKAQGGEWRNVFVDMNRAGGSQSNETYFRWAYTSITRSSGCLWLYRAPQFNYLSKLVVRPIQSQPKLKVSTATSDVDYRDERFSRIQRMALQVGMSASEDRRYAYQHRITLCNAVESATFVLWYNSKGYTKTTLANRSGDVFEQEAEAIIRRSLGGAEVTFSAPERPLAEKLFAYVRELLEGDGITLLNVTSENYCDTYHLQTDGVAKVQFFYNAKGEFTSMQPIGSLGESDGKLAMFCSHFVS